MKEPHPTLTVLAVAVPLAVGVTIGQAQAGTRLDVSAVTGQVVTGQYIVTLKSGAAGRSEAASAGIATRHVYDTTSTASPPTSTPPNCA